MATPGPSPPPCKPTAFTLVELMVVLAILALLSALMLSGLASARRSQKRDATKRFIGRLSDAIMDAYEDFEDVAPSIYYKAGGGANGLVAVRRRLRELFPDSWMDVAGVQRNGNPSNVEVGDLKTPAGRAYARYKPAGGLPTDQYEDAECLYMIITQSGLFPDLVAQIRPEQVGDVDQDGKREFLDAWGNPIAFLRWAPGYSSRLQIPNPATNPDPFDRATPRSELSAYALYPLIYSAGPDGSGGPNSGGPSPYGIAHAPLGWVSVTAICDFTVNGRLVGSPLLAEGNPNAHLDNITNHDLMFE
jgi:prepilin-type N-terminal cleavage/methylation domain-containing protein